MKPDSDILAALARAESGTRAGMARLATARDAAEMLEPLLTDALREKLCVLFIDAEQRLLAVREYQQGSEADVVIPVREILGEALQHGAASLLLAHNHPSGDPMPSEADREATRRLGALLAPLDMFVIDHLIYAAGQWRSLRGLGLL